MQRASSETQAANGALSLVRQPPITDLSQASSAAIMARSRFADVRDALLRKRNWNFAGAWTRPAAAAAGANGPLKTRYPMPEDCLAIREVSGCAGRGRDWDIEAATINEGEGTPTLAVVLVTNRVSPLVAYTRRVEQPALWDALFLTLFQKALGAELARSPLVRDTSLADDLNAEVAQALEEASRIDAREASAADIPRDSPWLDAYR